MVKAMVFPVVLYWCESLTIKKHRGLKNWCPWIVVLEKILESPLDSKKIISVYLKGNQSYIFIRRTDAGAEIPIFWPPEAELTCWKRPWSWERLGQEEKGTIEHEIVGWYHQLNGHEFEQTPGNSKGQESLKCCNLWVTKSQTRMSDWTTYNGYLNDLEGMYLTLIRISCRNISELKTLYNLLHSW